MAPWSSLGAPGLRHLDTFEWGPRKAAAMMKGKGRLALGKIKGPDTARSADRSQGMADKCLRRHNWLGAGGDHRKEAPTARLACADVCHGLVSEAMKILPLYSHCHHLSSGPRPPNHGPVSKLAPYVCHQHIPVLPAQGAPRTRPPGQSLQPGRLQQQQGSEPGSPRPPRSRILFRNGHRRNE